MFSQYTTQPNGKTYENWLSPTAYLRDRVRGAFIRARRRAKDKGLPFDIDIEYLITIYPSDGCCPALGFPLIWGGGQQDNSPALDRKVPALGYVRGNGAFISDLANRIKTNATTEQIISVAKYLKRITN